MFIRTILISSIACMATGAGTPNVIARDAAVKTEKETQPADRPKSLDAIKEAVKDLTDEQKEKLESLQKKAVAQQKALFETASITWSMSKQRREAYEALKAKGIKGKELSAQASKEADYTEEQVAAQSKVGRVWNDYRYAIINVLTAEQQKQLPKWLVSGHAARVKAEKEKAAAEKQ
ncbi:Spy/CpxP family protein refolding chaperone [Rubripirellula reticaptiva]|uniref:LTXXQ motif protein n=1 Tax=Rubripirellula reticaptiva TaxID=2528013 RepID=A0A5C6F742_9BACT|nr:Spy/CpxP family protein refolding chaperone [Rubripirellula reticaptiva]TWU55916.1 hypothetical protein Poly59_22190 [Rubripirellula reticaptiva]